MVPYMACEIGIKFLRVFSGADVDNR
jgi:hypothetical protein